MRSFIPYICEHPQIITNTVKEIKLGEGYEVPEVLDNSVKFFNEGVFVVSEDSTVAHFIPWNNVKSISFHKKEVTND